MSRRGSGGLTLDAGALIALDRPSRAAMMIELIDQALSRNATLAVPVGVIAQSWRSDRQVRMARLLKSFEAEIVLITEASARAVGIMCARTGHCDVIDVHVALCAAERNHAVVTSDPDDLARVDPRLPLIRI